VDYAALLAAVDKGQTPAVVLLHGPEPLLLEDAVARVTRALFGDRADLSLARELLDARESGAEAIVAAALVLPWDSARRLVVAKGVDGLTARQGDPLARYLSSPNPSTALLLVANQLLAPSHWLVSALPRAAVVPVPPPTAGQLAGWLRARARAEGFELEQDAAALLVDLCGEDLTQLRGELEKAALAGGAANKRVTAADVRAVVGEHRVRHIFELTRSLSRQDTGAALAVCESLLNAGEDPLGILAMLAREVRAAWQAADALRAGRPAEDIARALRRPPAAAAALIDRARGLDPARAMRLLERCWEAERRLKLGGVARPELSLLVADLCAD
jgi:DNA polymerase-3 subunit delta